MKIISNISIPQNCFLHKLTKLHGRQIWKDKKGFYYTFDKLHGHIEKWSRDGSTHLCVLNNEGKYVEGHKKDGRSIKNEI